MIINDLIEKAEKSLRKRKNSKFVLDPEIKRLDEEYEKNLKIFDSRKRKFDFLRPLAYSFFIALGAFIGTHTVYFEGKKEFIRAKYNIETGNFQRAEKHHSTIMSYYLRDGALGKVSEGKMDEYLKFAYPTDSSRVYSRKLLDNFKGARNCTAVEPCSINGRDFAIVGDNFKSAHILDLKSMNWVKNFIFQSIPRGIQREKSEEGDLSLIINSDGGKIYRVRYANFTGTPKTSRRFRQSLLFDAGEEISEPKIIDFNGDGKNEYFFNTKSGKIKGIDNEGKICFYYNKIDKSELVPVGFINDSGLLKIISNDENRLIAVYRGKDYEKKMDVLWTGEKKIETNICVDGSYIAFGTNKSIVSLDLKNKKEYSKRIIGKFGSLEYSTYNSTVAFEDFGNNSEKDIVLTHGCYFFAFDRKCRQLCKTDFDNVYNLSKPVIADIDGDGRNEIMTNTNGDLYMADFNNPLNVHTKKVAGISPSNSEYEHNSIRLLERNGKMEYIVSSGEGVYLIGSALLKPREGLKK
ncbi:MAG: hypothetical protein WC475_01295 [Candidatus Paceibacterota bacterium]